MSELFAIDTNIAVYAFGADEKRDTARSLLKSAPAVSVQVLNEFANVSRRKLGRSWAEIGRALADIRLLAFTVRDLDVQVHEIALQVAERYGLSLYDSLIVSAALSDQCAVLYSEDMQHGLVVDGRLKIINPFQK